ncbi:MAG: phosphopantetheine-binding protein [Gemmatimonadales bacterium]
MSERDTLRGFIAGLLRDRDDTADIYASESLFVSGRLDSLAAVEVVAFLEESFAVDFAATDFAIERIDSIDAIATLVDEARG